MENLVMTIRTVKVFFFYLTDTPYFFPNANMETMAAFYAGQYPQMNAEDVSVMAEMLNLDMKQPLRTFSKGMKRQAFLILALCANTKYLFCDEVFDGLDPIVTEVMKNLIKEAMQKRQFTVVAVSHKLRDLEDICDRIVILHKGGLISSDVLEERVSHIRKFQCVWEDDRLWEEQKALFRKQLDIVKCQKEGCFVTMLVRSKETENLTDKMESYFPIFCKEIPMTLEETFILEMEESGYDIRKVLY